MAAKNPRPGCLSVFCVLQMLGGGLFLLGGIGLMVESEPGAGLLSLLLAALQVAVAVGLWKMQSWAWWLTMVIVGLGSLGSLVNLVDGQFEALGALAVQGAILYWFGAHKSLFETSQVGAAFSRASSPQKRKPSIAAEATLAPAEPSPASLEAQTSADLG